MIEKKLKEKQNRERPCCNLCTRSTKQPKRAYFRYCRRKKIPFQRLASSRVTGTDTDAFAYSNGGVALISLPLRYMHTTVEMVHRDDVENQINLRNDLEVREQRNVFLF
jgi:putative aminopeptidase FrvX